MRLEHLATAIFGIAVLHTFLVGRMRKIAHAYPEGSMGENFFHLMGETEAVFILWAGFLWLVHTCFSAVQHINGHAYSLTSVTEGLGHGWHEAIHYIENLNYTEPKFVFVIMVIAGTKPVIDVAEAIIRTVARLIPLPPSAAFLLSALFTGSQLGSIITEPAAMTVTAIVLVRQYFNRGYSRAFKYMLVGTLFVLVSIGGVHTPFAAPPVLMVAGKWQWDIVFMERHFGWKAAVAILTSSLLIVTVFMRQLRAIPLLTDSELQNPATDVRKAPWWVIATHLGALAFVVLTAHHSDVFMGIFIFFLGFCVVTKEYQEALKVKEGLLVGGFLAGLVTLGGMQSWWLEPLLASLNELQLYLGATALTAITDNAALTFLGSQVEGLSDAKKYALVAGAVSGGGLTVIANAPNPAGYSIINPVFGEEGGIGPLGLLLGALPATIIAMICFWYLPSL